LPTRQVVTLDGPHPPVQLVTGATTPELGSTRRPCPPRARSIGNWRSLTVNDGRFEERLSCGIGVASGQDDGAGRAFQARDRWGHIGATSGPQTTGSQRTTTVTSGPASSQVMCHVRPGSAGRLDRPALSRTEQPKFKADPGSGRLRRPSWAGNPTSKEHRAFSSATGADRLTRQRIRSSGLLGRRKGSWARASVAVRSPGQVHGGPG
jgi:hypothetical protein